MTGRREANKRRTRETLERAAFDLFLEQGYDQTSVTELAAAADVAERTFFRYFATKDDVVFAKLDEDIDDFLRHLGAELRSDAPSWADIARGVEAFCRHYEPEKAVTQRRSQLVMQTPFLAERAHVGQAKWRQAMTTLLAERYGRPTFDIDVQLLAGAASAVLIAAFGHWVRSDEELHTLARSAGDRIVGLLEGER
ncbi:MAG: regulatory protein TetR [Actinomycetia bacterium]|nr:regulatory protein TetR [Actinomycetes bacterium]